MTKTHQADLPSDQIPEADPLAVELSDDVATALEGMLAGLRQELQKSIAASERLRSRSGLPARTPTEKSEQTNILRKQIADRIVAVLKGEVTVKKAADGSPDPDDLGVSLLAAGAMRKQRLGMKGFAVRLAKEGFGDPKPKK